MQPKSEYPFTEWFKAHLAEGKKTEAWQRLNILEDAWDANGVADRIEGEWEAWWADQSRPMPNLVECVSQYGLSRLLIRGWKEFPIEVPPSKAEAWREWGFGASLFEFRETWQGGLAGGFLELAGRDSSMTVQVLRRQLQTKVDRLNELTGMPVEWYTPQEFTIDERAEMEDRVDRDRINEPFKLFELLYCFKYAFPKLRLFAITDHDPEINLPNPELHEAMKTLDINALIWRLEQFEKRLHAIMDYLIKCRYPSLDYEFDNPRAIEEFWWRHKKTHRAKAKG